MDAQKKFCGLTVSKIFGSIFGLLYNIYSSTSSTPFLLIWGESSAYRLTLFIGISSAEVGFPTPAPQDLDLTVYINFNVSVHEGCKSVFDCQ